MKLPVDWPDPCLVKIKLQIELPCHLLMQLHIESRKLMIKAPKTIRLTQFRDNRNGRCIYLGGGELEYHKDHTMRFTIYVVVNIYVLSSTKTPAVAAELR